MKKFILITLVSLSFFIMGCAAHIGNDIPTQYKAVAFCEDGDTTTILYTFKGGTLYVDEVGNEGFAYRYVMEKRNQRNYLRYYDEVWGELYEYEIIYTSNGDIIIKFDEGDVLLQKQKKVIDLGFD